MPSLRIFFNAAKETAKDLAGWAHEKLKSHHRKIKNLGILFKALAIPLNSRTSQGALITSIISNWLTILGTYLNLENKENALKEDNEFLEEKLGITPIKNEEISRWFHTAQSAFLITDLLVFILTVQDDISKEARLSYLIINALTFYGYSSLSEQKTGQFGSSEREIIKALKISAGDLKTLRQKVADLETEQATQGEVPALIHRNQPVETAEITLNGGASQLSLGGAHA